MKTYNYYLSDTLSSSPNDVDLRSLGYIEPMGQTLHELINSCINNGVSPEVVETHGYDTDGFDPNNDFNSDPWDNISVGSEIRPEQVVIDDNPNPSPEPGNSPNEPLNTPNEPNND